jgi:glycosyltransferase involved in cell wall biosynthesis
MRREKPAIVHTHTAKAGTVGRVAGLMYRWLTPGAVIGKPRSCRFVHTYHGHVFHSYYGPLKSRMFLRIERWLARVATDRIVVISEQQRREINETFRVGNPGQFRIVPLGIDLSVYSGWAERRSQLRNELRASDDELLIGIIGRLTEIKNHGMFLEAAARLTELLSSNAVTESPNPAKVRFVIIGDGRLRMALEAQARALNLSGQVVFLGTRDDPENFYPSLDMVALTSLNEGTPLTLIEAMANARPVIATGVGGVVDLLGPARAAPAQNSNFALCDRGIRVDAIDANAFAAGLGCLAADPALRDDLATRGFEFVTRNYGRTRLIQDIATLYGEL